MIKVFGYIRCTASSFFFRHINLLDKSEVVHTILRLFTLEIIVAYVGRDLGMLKPNFLNAVIYAPDKHILFRCICSGQAALYCGHAAFLIFNGLTKKVFGVTVPVLFFNKSRMAKKNAFRGKFE